ncbi:MAG: glucose-1-phosphate adenylyltransferase subunit GlgD [Firmicutes bacterium]|nr:glucose-1-phosphate adenylyltransferase subunit GlgD [Bacillota bacterium]
MYSIDGIVFTNCEFEGLSKLASDRTVAALPFWGKYRLIDFPLSTMTWHDITTIGIITPYKYRSIVDHVGSGKPWGLDKKTGGLHILPGTVWGYSNANSRFVLRDLETNKIFLDRSSADYILITAANTVARVDYEDLVKHHHESKADMTIVYKVAEKANENMSAVRVEKGKVLGMHHGVKKGEPMFIDCFVVNRRTLYNILKFYKAINFMDLFDILGSEFSKMDIRAYEYSDFSYSIFTEKDYFNANMEILNEEVYTKLLLEGRQILTKQHDHMPTKFVEGSKVKRSIVQDGSLIEGTVENSIIGSGVTIERGAKVTNSIIFQGCVIEAGAKVDYSIIDRRNVVNKKVAIKGTKGNPFVMEKVLR